MTLTIRGWILVSSVVILLVAVLMLRGCSSGPQVVQQPPPPPVPQQQPTQAQFNVLGVQQAAGQQQPSGSCQHRRPPDSGVVGPMVSGVGQASKDAIDLTIAAGAAGRDVYAKSDLAVNGCAKPLNEAYKFRQQAQSAYEHVERSKQPEEQLQDNFDLQWQGDNGLQIQEAIDFGDAEIESLRGKILYWRQMYNLCKDRGLEDSAGLQNRRDTIRDAEKTLARMLANRKSLGVQGMNQNLATEAAERRAQSPVRVYHGFTP